MIKQQRIGVILMTYGSPATLADIPLYLKHVYGGKDASAEVIQEFKRRYALIGGSPLIQITQQQAQALETKLNTQNHKNPLFRVAAGMRFSPPFIAEVASQLADNSDQLIGIIMSPQYSPIIMKGYIDTLEKTVQSLPNRAIKLKVAHDWHLQPLFIGALAERVKQALVKFDAPTRKHLSVLLTAHSMPKRVIEREPNYIDDLKETASMVAKKSGLSSQQWQFCYQSAGHTPEEWLKPDFADIMPQMKAEGKTHVLIAPIQFLADHLEILYDIEIGAREQAEAYGIKFTRTESLNTSPLFIQALAEVVKDTLRN